VFFCDNFPAFPYEKVRRAFTAEKISNGWKRQNEKRTYKNSVSSFLIHKKPDTPENIAMIEFVSEFIRKTE
jgi:hypothetical protein